MYRPLRNTFLRRSSKEKKSLCAFNLPPIRYLFMMILILFIFLYVFAIFSRGWCDREVWYVYYTLFIFKKCIRLLYIQTNQIILLHIICNKNKYRNKIYQINLIDN